MNNFYLWLVEDDLIFKSIFEQQLYTIDKSIELVFFENAELALNKLTTNKESKLPHLIFLDLEMPYMDGFQFLESLQKSFLDTKLEICVITSSIDSKDFKRVMQTGLVKKYLVKPLKIDQIKEVLKSISHN